MQVILSEKLSRAGSRQTTHGTDSVKSYLQEIGRIPMLTAAEEITLGQQVQTRVRLLAAKAALTETLGQMPSDAEWARNVELTLTKLKAALHQGEKAKKRMIEANLRLVVSVAKKY